MGQGNGAAAVATLVKALLAELGSQDGDGQGSAYVVGAEDVVQRKGPVNGADILLVVHEAPYDLVCGMGEAEPADAAVTNCRRRAQQASDLQSGLGRLLSGDSVLHIDGSAMRTFAGAAMVAQELLDWWGMDAAAVDLKEVVEDAQLVSIAWNKAGTGPDHAAAAARRHCIDIVDSDAVCRAWHDFFYELFPPSAPPIVDQDEVTVWLPTALEAAAVAAEAIVHGETLGQEKKWPAPPPAAADAWKQQAGDEDDDELTEIFYCLPGGGLNDITVEWWKCIEWAIQTGRTLVSGFENYLAAVPPYTPYFELKALPGLKTMSPAEAARRIRKARSKGTVTIFPRRLQRDPRPILEPIADSEEEKAAILAGKRPWRFDWDDLHRLGFEFEKQYGQQVVVFHRKGNVGAFS